MNIKIKICGITNVPDALAAVEAGADALGFIFFDGSPRYIAPDIAARIIRKLPPFVGRVGVFVDAREDFIRETIAQCGLSAIQLHGEETPEFCGRFSVSVIKAFRLINQSSLGCLPEYDTAAWLLDSYVPGQLGGTGQPFNWDLACQAKQWKCPVILAGGLSPANVAEAVQQVLPYGIDVSSGVEDRPGKKNPEAIRQFIQTARAAIPF